MQTANGGSRQVPILGHFCIQAWIANALLGRDPKGRDVEKVQAMIGTVKSMGLETCTTPGMSSDEQAQQLKQAGLDYYMASADIERGNPLCAWHRSDNDRYRYVLPANDRLLVASLLSDMAEDLPLACKI